MSYKSSCATHIKNLGLNEAEIILLNKEVAKKSDSISKIKEIQSKLKITSEDRKLIAEYRKILNDVKDTIKSDYQRMAKDSATDKLSTLTNRVFKDRLVKNPTLLKDMLLNTAKATKDSIWSKRFIEKSEFTSYCKDYDKNNPDLDNIKDEEFNDINNKMTKGFVDHVRKYMDTKYLENTGKKYFNSDLEHSVKLNNDYMRENIDDFIQALKDNSNAEEMILNNFRGIEDKVEGFEEKDLESAVGSYRDSQRLNLFKNLKQELGSLYDNSFDSLNYGDIVDKNIFDRLFSHNDNYNDLNNARSIAIVKSYDKLLNDFKESINAGRKPKLSIHKITFKDNDSYTDFINKWSISKSPIINYRESMNTFISMNVIRGEMGYVPTMKFLPNEVFANGFTREYAESYMDMFLGSPLTSTEKQMKAIRNIKRFKSLVISSRTGVLPYWSAVDAASSKWVELSKNNQLDFFRDTSNTFSRVVNGFLESTITSAKITKEITKSMLLGTAKRQITKISELMGDIANYESLHDSIEMKDKGLWKGINFINKRFMYEPQIRADNAHRYATWMSNVKTLANLDFDKPCGFLERMKNLKLSNDELKEMKKSIIESQGVIEDVKDKKVRENLYLLKYNSDMSAVPLDITPTPIIKIQNPIAKAFLNFFVQYHIKTGQQLLSVLKNANTKSQMVSTIFTYSLMGLPANMSLNYLMNVIYTGQIYNPFDNFRDGRNFIAESALGQVSRPGMILWAVMTGDKSGSNPLINPMFSEISNIYHGLNSKYVDSILSNSYYSAKDQDSDINKIVKAVAGVTPFGQIGESALKYSENN